MLISLFILFINMVQNWGKSQPTLKCLCFLLRGLHFQLFIHLLWGNSLAYFFMFLHSFPGSSGIYCLAQLWTFSTKQLQVFCPHRSKGTLTAWVAFPSQFTALTQDTNICNMTVCSPSRNGQIDLLWAISGEIRKKCLLPVRSSFPAAKGDPGGKLAFEV